ncbi:hypothetical protein F5Y09DRAFT_314474 [Xylaria sp. FL1042]|nr:hypothetical protein F5Y09DRAFT_314474 [Xylaria sp. FL1042]
MRPQITTVLLGLATAAPASALDLYQDGPFALRVKGQAKNSSIDGYLHTADVGPVLIQKPIQYEPISSLPAGNISYEFYFNYTGNSQSDEYEVGFFVTNVTRETSSEVGTFYGQAMSLQFSAGSNVAFAVVGAGSAISTAFDKENKTLINLYFDDATFVPNDPPKLDQSFNFYNWAICWQFFGNVYVPALSWITYGPSHNPTCERVDVLKAAI